MSKVLIITFADGVDEKLIAAWVKKHGWETVLNKRGTTWRKLDDKTKGIRQ